MMLDVGCGDFPRGDVNLDLYPGKVVHGREMPIDVKRTLNFVKGDASHLPFKDESFDVCFSTHLIEHLDDPVLLIKEMMRVTKKVVGEVIIQCPHRFGWGAKRPFHQNYFNKAWFMKTINNLGVKHSIRYLSFRYSKPFPLLMLPNELEVRIKP